MDEPSQEQILVEYTVASRKYPRDMRKATDEALVALNSLTLKQVLVLIGKQSPYKGGNYSYWSAEKRLRAELRASAERIWS